MKIIFYKIFQKKLKKRTNEEHIQLKNRLSIFINNPFNIILNNHALHGKYAGFRSIDILGDLRAIYKIQADNIALFVDIDNHANLYK